MAGYCGDVRTSAPPLCQARVSDPVPSLGSSAEDFSHGSRFSGLGWYLQPAIQTKNGMGFILVYFLWPHRHPVVEKDNYIYWSAVVLLIKYLLINTGIIT